MTTNNTELADKDLNFTFFPKERLLPEYPFCIWLAGCIALTKGFIWPCQQNLTPCIFLFPLMILFGAGIWNFRRWAYWGLLSIAVLELVLYIFFPFEVFHDIHDGYAYGFYTRIFNLLVGPAGDLAIIGALLSSLGHMKKPFNSGGKP